MYTALGLLEGAVLSQYPDFVIKGGGSRWRRAEGWADRPLRRENFLSRTMSATREKARNQLGRTATRADDTDGMDRRVVMLGLPTAAPNGAPAPEHADDIDPWQTDQHFVLSIISCFP